MRNFRQLSRDQRDRVPCRRPQTSKHPRLPKKQSYILNNVKRRVANYIHKRKCDTSFEYLSVLQRLHGSRDASASLDEFFGASVVVELHDGAGAEKTAELELFAFLVADCGNHADCGCL